MPVLAGWLRDLRCRGASVDDVTRPHCAVALGALDAAAEAVLGHVGIADARVIAEVRA